MAWVYLLFAGLFEIGWVIGLKFSEGFSRPVPSAWTVAAMGVSFWCLSLAVKSLPLGTSYAIWTGIGSVGAMLAGIILFGESVSVLRLACAGLILMGIAGLKVSA